MAMLSEKMLKIKPNIQFIKELSKDSNSPLKQCMQCGNCSVVCNLSPDKDPFPRKEMMWASWGLKDKLMGDPDIWLCHQCGDCTEYCPRGVKPGDVLLALRNYTYTHYARPKFLGKLISKPKFLPLIIAIPVVIILLILMLVGTLQIPEGTVNYSKLFPHAYLNSSFGILALLTFIGVAFSIRDFWKDMSLRIPAPKKNSIFKSLILTVEEIFLHKKFQSCNTRKSWFILHLMMFWGFAILLLVTAFAVLAVIFFKYPFDFWHPVKIAGNIAGIILFFSSGIILIQRLFKRPKAGNTSYPDRLFLTTFNLLVLSGFVVEIARLQDWSLAYHLYFLHLVCVWVVIIYLPFTKFGHIIYRTVAVTFAKVIGRN